MSEYYFTARLDDKRTLVLAPLSDRRIEHSGQHLNDTSGYFLYEQHGNSDDAAIEILAQAVSEYAALRLREMLRMS